MNIQMKTIQVSCSRIKYVYTSSGVCSLAFNIYNSMHMQFYRVLMQIYTTIQTENIRIDV